MALEIKRIQLQEAEGLEPFPISHSICSCCGLSHPDIQIELDEDCYASVGGKLANLTKTNWHRSCLDIEEDQTIFGIKFKVKNLNGV